MCKRPFKCMGIRAAKVLTGKQTCTNTFSSQKTEICFVGFVTTTTCHRHSTFAAVTLQSRCAKIRNNWNSQIQKWRIENYILTLSSHDINHHNGFSKTQVALLPRCMYSLFQSTDVWSFYGQQGKYDPKSYCGLHHRGFLQPGHCKNSIPSVIFINTCQIAFVLNAIQQKIISIS